nr:hypothetical protein [Paracidovorax avenae]
MFADQRRSGRRLRLLHQLPEGRPFALQTPLERVLAGVEQARDVVQAGQRARR